MKRFCFEGQGILIVLNLRGELNLKVIDLRQLKYKMKFQNSKNIWVIPGQRTFGFDLHRFKKKK